MTGSLLAHDTWGLTHCSQNLTGEAVFPSFTDQAAESRWLKNHPCCLHKPISAPKSVLRIFLVKATHQSSSRRDPLPCLHCNVLKILTSMFEAQTRFPISDWSRQHWQNQSTASQCSKPPRIIKCQQNPPLPRPPRSTGLLTELLCTPHQWLLGDELSDASENVHLTERRFPL